MTDTNLIDPEAKAAQQDNVVALPANETEAAESGKSRGVSQFVRDHPVLAVAGGITAGLLAGALLHKGTRRKLSRGGARFAEIAAVQSVALARQALELANATGAELRERGEAVASRAERLGEAATDRIEHIGETTRDRVRTIVTPAEQAAARASRKVTEKAAEFRARMAR